MANYFFIATFVCGVTRKYSATVNDSDNDEQYSTVMINDVK